MTTTHSHTNRLARESSPYLKQHAHNPVDWYPWGPEALQRARQLVRPLFLSIGYSACHWCHVMERESFEDPEVAALLNEHFINVKVDREERPDLDQIYMTAVQAITGQGGWPMSVFLTPDLKPFYGGTYFPPDDRYGRPSFRRVLQAVIEAWRERRVQLLQTAEQLTERIRLVSGAPPAGGAVDDQLIRGAAAQLKRAFDPMHGGFGSAPKFPHPMDLRLLLRAWKRFGDDELLRMVRVTLDRMAMGGTYDQLGGGFHRYSTDERWLVPHFEKMLYDNALLTTAYLEGLQATGEPIYGRVAEETLQYVLREMTSPQGPFYSTQDADSEGEEGKFFVWSAAEVHEVLGPELAEIAADAYDITPEGNWEGHNILHRTKTDAQQARLLGLSEEQFRRQLNEVRQRLFERRERRVKPGRDEKILTAWNGLMIDALARAAEVLEVPHYAEAAGRAADFLLTRMRGPDGRLLRTYSAGAEPKLNAYLEDYAFLIEGLVSLYQASFTARWLGSALELAHVMIAEFWDETEGGFFYTGQRHEPLIARAKDMQDSSIPSGNAMAATALLRLAALTERTELADSAAATLRVFAPMMAEAPSAAGQMLVALDFHLGPVREVAVIGDAASEQAQRALRAIRRPFRPHQVLAQGPRDEASRPTREVPLLAGKPALGEVTTYICENQVCQAPLVGADAVEAAVAGEARR